MSPLLLLYAVRLYTQCFGYGDEVNARRQFTWYSFNGFCHEHDAQFPLLLHQARYKCTVLFDVVDSVLLSPAMWWLAVSSTVKSSIRMSFDAHTGMSCLKCLSRCCCFNTCTRSLASLLTLFCYVSITLSPPKMGTIRAYAIRIFRQPPSPT